MITTDIPIDKIEGKDFMPVDLGITNEEPATSDKRTEPRKQIIFQLKCKIYDSELDIFKNSDALVRNFSSNGLYFEAANPFQPEDPVCLSIRDQITGKYDAEFAIGIHAQIVWCKPLNTNFDPRYGVGVKFFEPVKSHIGSF